MMNPTDVRPAIVQHMDAVKLARDLVAELRQDEGRALQAAYKLGQILREQKEKARAGQWGATLNEIGIKQQRASEFMRIATLDPFAFAQLESIRAALEYLHDRDNAKSSGGEVPPISSYQDFTGAPVKSQSEGELQVVAEDDGTDSQQAVSKQGLMADDDRAADTMDNFEEAQDEGQKVKVRSSSARVTTPPKQPTLLDDPPAVDPEVATRRKRVASVQAMAKRGITKIDELHDLIAQMDDADTDGRVRRSAHEVGTQIRTREVSLPPDGENRFQSGTVKKAYSPELEKLKTLFSLVAEGEHGE